MTMSPFMRLHSKKILVFLLLFGLFASGCSSHSKGGSDAGAEGEEGGLLESDLAKEETRWQGGGNIPRAEEGNVFEDVHFAYDSAVISPEEQEVVRRNAELLKKDSTLHAELEGHCDKRGTAEYNMVLGEQRAKSVASALVGLGVKPVQVSTISYGAEVPLDPANNETAFAKNRRAHLAVYRKQAQEMRGQLERRY